MKKELEFEKTGYLIGLSEQEKIEVNNLMLEAKKVIEYKNGDSIVYSIIRRVYSNKIEPIKKRELININEIFKIAEDINKREYICLTVQDITSDCIEYANLLKKRYEEKINK